MTKEEFKSNIKSKGNYKAQKHMLKCAKSNSQFMNDILIADNDKAPSYLATIDEKFAFISMYYGWLVGKYGVNDWYLYF